jgi:hypothetical protein
VGSGSQCSPDNYVQVRRRKRRHWINESDEQSKRMFLIARILLWLTDTTSAAQASLVTIPAGQAGVFEFIILRHNLRSELANVFVLQKTRGKPIG